ncbi:mycodextranase, partial [Streptomyces sp. MBT57]|nr:mycodextranase [Streptomyces sp. MBT57]
KPSGALDVVSDFGADPTGAADATAKIQAAVDAGRTQGREVYIPQGTFKVQDHIIVDKVTLRGAGPWYSVLTGRHPTERHKAVGVYGKYASQGGSSNVTLKDFAIIGDIRERIDDDQVNAIGGSLSDSVVDNLWLQHTKCGAWLTGPMNNFTMKNTRILDQTADGVNFHYGVTNSTVTNTFVRNSGDDGLAMWAENIPNVNNKFTFNTVILPILANNIVTYGGKDITISDNVMSDSITNGGGLHIANRYPGVNSGRGTAVSGTHTAARNTLIRTGNNDFNWQFGVGAVWFSGLNEPIQGATINVTDTEILDSSYAAIHLIEGASNGLNFNRVKIDGAGTYALQIQSPGRATFTDVVATNIAQSNPIHNCVGAGFQITRGSGNSG